MDNLVIENLACIEVNRVIFQEPFKLVSEIKTNDKSPSFDGEILVYDSKDLKKRNLEGSVKVQIKGTTVYKKNKKSKITYVISKEDLEVYKRFGEGVLYFVVTISPKTHKAQIYYNALSPLDIERYLNDIKRNETNSISIQFSCLLDNHLDSVCRIHLSNVRRQPAYYIDGSKRKEFKEYKVEYNLIDEGFNFFEDIGYVYGVEGDLEFPVEAIIPNNVNIEGKNYFEIDGSRIATNYRINDTPKEMVFWFEDTIEISLKKNKKTAKLNIDNFKSINSYITSLKVLKYILINNKLPLEIYEIGVSLNEKERYTTIDEEIVQYSNLLKVCESIGISGDYYFDKDENVKELFHSITELFVEKKYHLIKKDTSVEDSPIIKLRLSDHIKIFLYRDEENGIYYNMFSKEILNKFKVYIPKVDGAIDPKEDDHFNVSLYSMYPVKEIADFANFNFELYKKSFDEEKHEISLENNNNIALELINIFDENNRKEFLELAIDLLEGLIRASENNEVYRLNLLQTNKRLSKNLTIEEEEYLYTIIDSTNDKNMKLVANVLLGLKIPAQRIFDSFDEDEKSGFKKWPIYNLFLKL